MEIKSKENNQIKYIKNLFQKKFRDENKEYIVEGTKLVEEAMEYSNVSKIIISSTYSKKEEIIKISKDMEIIEVSDNLFSYLSDTKSPQGIMAVVKQNLNQKIKKDDILFILDDIQDPGNLGTIIRTLDSAGYKSLVLSKNTVDVYNSKVVRSTMGAIFRINFIKLDMELSRYIKSLKEEDYKIAVTSLKDSYKIYDFDFNNKIAIIMGNEANGVEKEIFELADYKINIPMIGKTESLNVAVATSIIAYEKVRRANN